MHCLLSLRPFALLLALLLVADTAAAQRRFGRVRGIVVDSLLRDVLPGAEVRIGQLGRRAETDSAGRFALDSVPAGEWAVEFRHPALDSLGIAVPPTRVRVFAGASAALVLATPPFEPIRDRFCGATADSLSPTVAFGSVQTTTGARVAVNVAVSWVLGSASEAGPRPGSVRTTPDGDRLIWVACGIPSAGWFIASVGDSTRSATALARMGPRGLAMHDLVLGSGESEIAGTVRDSEGRPVAGARVSVVGGRSSNLTDATGRFVLTHAPSGTLTLDVRAPAFQPWIVPVRGGEVVQVRLIPLTEPRLASDVHGSDYLRFLQRSSRPGATVIAGADLAGDSAALETLPPASTCSWWLDGLPVSREFLQAQPRWSWRALEVYARGEDAPPEYRGPGCPVALLWTSSADW
jgi:hypothetical protein